MSDKKYRKKALKIMHAMIKAYYSVHSPGTNPFKEHLTIEDVGILTIIEKLYYSHIVPNGPAQHAAVAKMKEMQARLKEEHSH